MIKRLKYLVSLLLVIIFLTPMSIQLFDGIFHHHHHEQSSVNQNHFQTYHEKCPIPDFQLSIFSLQKQIVEIGKPIYPHPLIISFRSAFPSDKSKYSFLLRAPPIQTRFI